MIYIVTIALLLFFQLYSKWQFIDDAGGVSGKWHTSGAIMRAVFFAPTYLMVFFDIAVSKGDLILATAMSLPLWDIGLNIIALKKPIFYVGATSEIDIKFGQKKWIYYSIILITAILLKIFL